MAKSSATSSSRPNQKAKDETRQIRKQQAQRDEVVDEEVPQLSLAAEEPGDQRSAR